MLEKRHKIKILVCLLNSHEAWTFLARVTTSVQENYFQMSWGESWQKHKNVQNEGVVKLMQVTMALTSGHCHNQKSVFENMPWDAQIFKLSTAENITQVFIHTHTRLRQVIYVINC